MGKLQLIVNGDDFGASEEVNEAIVRGFKEGCLTSCSLMVTGKAFDHAVRLAKENEKLAVGIHLVTVKGRAVLPHNDIPSLVDEVGRFPEDPTAAGLKYFFSAQARRELRKELEAQFAKFASTGLMLSHVDSHLHMHINPVIFRMAVELAKQYGARRMRAPEDDLWAALRFEPDQAVTKSFFALVFRLLTRRMKKELLEQGFVFPDRVYGHFQSGRMSEEYVLFILDQLRTAAGEIYFHPAVYDARGALSPEQAQCSRELSILLSRQVIASLGSRGIEPVTYFDLESCP